jgi:hypothetical protein
VRTGLLTSKPCAPNAAVPTTPPARVRQASTATKPGTPGPAERRVQGHGLRNAGAGEVTGTTHTGQRLRSRPPRKMSMSSRRARNGFAVLRNAPAKEAPTGSPFAVEQPPHHPDAFGHETFVRGGYSASYAASGTAPTPADRAKGWCDRSTSRVHQGATPSASRAAARRAEPPGLSGGAARIEQRKTSAGGWGALCRPGRKAGRPIRVLFPTLPCCDPPRAQGRGCHLPHFTP